VHRSAVLDALSALFEALWDVALPLRLGDRDGDDSGGLSTDDRLLLNLLTAGVPDEAMARHLQISYRTVQRRLQALMQRAGVTTRFQLGMHASVQGRLSPPMPRDTSLK
jgi:DNA-binding NarL/FixJ family response regulator